MNRKERRRARSGENYRVIRSHLPKHGVLMNSSQDGIKVKVVEIGAFPRHAEAYAAVIADHAKIDPGGALFWTRPNWTAVTDNEEAPLCWTIVKFSNGAPQLGAWGPYAFETNYQ
jgi:hypothetical protein